MEYLAETLLKELGIPTVEETFQPEYILSGSGFAWYYSDTKRTMVRVKRGSECTIFEDTIEVGEKVLVQIGNEILLVDSSEIIEIGWN